MALTRPAAPADARVTRFTVDFPEKSGTVPTLNPTIALSADGTQLALTPWPGKGLVVRRLDALDSQPMEVTKGAWQQAPFFFSRGCTERDPRP